VFRDGIFSFLVFVFLEPLTRERLLPTVPEEELWLYAGLGWRGKEGKKEGRT